MSENGLRSYGFHSGDPSAAAVMDALADERASSPTFTTTGPDPSALDPETAARQYLSQALASDAMAEFSAATVNGAESEFRTIDTQTMPLTGTKVVKFRQEYQKIPVYGALVSVELGDRNELLAIQSALGEPANVDPVATRSPREALAKAAELAGSGTELLGATPRLSYYYDPIALRWRLVYVIEDVRKRAQGGPQATGSSPWLVDYVIDAHSGELVAELPRTPNVGSAQESALDGLEREREITVFQQSDTLRILFDPANNVRTFDFGFQDLDTGILPGQVTTNPPDPWQTGAVSAHANAAVVGRFLREALRRNLIDDRGGTLISSVNCILAAESPDRREWRNAAWVGTQMVYGQRRVGSGLRSYAVGLDVVGHEIFHGVTDRTARLEYRIESGAMNESYSDIFGLIISNLGERDISRWNFEMGEELEGTGIPLRDLSNPPRFRQPDHMRDFRRLPPGVPPMGGRFGNDFGFVHGNSGIHNKAAFNLMTARDSGGRLLFDPPTVAALFYLTLTQRLSRTSGFNDSRRGITLTAQTLFRNESEEVRNAKLAAITAAFEAVGITP